MTVSQSEELLTQKVGAYVLTIDTRNNGQESITAKQSGISDLYKRQRYGCAVLAATIMALNIKTFVRAGGLFPGGFTGLTLLLQNIFQDVYKRQENHRCRTCNRGKRIIS